jgi:hypothetical protein
MGYEEVTPQKENIQELLKKYATQGETPIVTNNSIPKAPNFNPQEFEKTMSRETDPDLIISYEIVKLPSKGLFYSNGISEVNVEYMTSRDEDLLTTPSLIESGTVLDLLLKRKIKTAGINPEDLLAGDRNAIILFLRSSSYGSDYTVQVTDPRTGNPFKTTVDLTKLKYKEVKEIPNENGYYSVELPMRKKTVLFRLLTVGEDSKLYKNAEAIKEAKNEDYSQYSTMRLKASVVSINDNTDRTYISKFIDAMPALDAYTIRRKILDVSPDVDMEYVFTAKDGYTFNANLTVGLDFFFPNT